MDSIPKRGYTIIKEGTENVMKIDASAWTFTPSIEDNAIVMGRVVDFLVEYPGVKRIIFSQRRNYTYNEEQTLHLIELANLYKSLVRQKKLLSLGGIAFKPEAQALVGGWRAIIQDVVINKLRGDPVGAYVELKRIIRNEKIKIEKMPLELVEVEQNYIDILQDIYLRLGKTRLINLVKDQLSGYTVGDRGIYTLVFRPSISPDFIFTQLMMQHPLDGEEIGTYSFNNNDIMIYRVPGDIKYLYHLTPPEFKISEDKYALLDKARRVLAEHKPQAEEFLDPERMRNTFLNIGKDLLQELSESRGMALSLEELDELAKILVRYTIGFGLIEVLLEDEKIQDININGPIGQTPIFILHEDYDECVTNIIPSAEDAASWASKFRILSGRPLDEANPILDTELILPKARARVAIIQKPLNPFGLGYAFRRHRDKPWTYPLFIKNKMMSPLAAGLLNFLVDGSRTLLFAGTRSSGKTSLLGSTLVEIMRKHRVITIEDTLELPVESLRKLGYNIQSMKVRSALTKGGSEVAADEGIRVSLRLGDSSLIVGEIRSVEAFALYEAMRIGALANVVAGTIHGDSPYGVFDRVVNDLKVPRTSFKATDIIIISNPVKSPDGLHRWRRIMSITEVRKHWEEDPLREKGFVDLMKYDSKTDRLEVTDDLMNGDSEIIKTIAGNVREWVGDWEAVWDNILLRAKIKETLVKYAEKSKMPDLLEAGFVVASNDVFHRLSNQIKEEVGSLDNKRIFFEWEEWVKREIRLRSLK